MLTEVYFFFLHTNFFTASVLNKQYKEKTSSKGYNTPKKFFAYPGFVYSGFEQPTPDAPPLCLAKAINIY